jgi:hypothetical protein
MNRRAFILLPVGLVGLAILLVVGRSQLKPLGAYYSGHIPEVGQAQITFWKRGDGYRGRLWVEGFGEAWRLELAKPYDHSAVFLTLHWEDGRQTNGWIQVAGVIGSDRLMASWRSSHSRDDGQDFTLTNVAVASGVAVERNLSFKDRGGWYQMHLAGPTLPAETPTGGHHEFFIGLLEDDLRELRAEFGGSIRNAVIGFREGRCSIVECERYYEIRLLTPALISVLADGYESRGGSGNPQKYQGMNFVRAAGGFSEFALPTLFRGESEWRQSLLTLSQAELARQGRHPSSQDIENQLDALHKFTVSQTGLQIYFNPYTIGSGAEGSAVIHLDYTVIHHLLDTNGLAGWLPCFQASP